METQIHNLSDRYVIHNCIGDETYFSGEIIAWNSVSLILLFIASLMFLVNRLKSDDEPYNRLIKLLYGTLAVVALAGVLYPVEFGLIGVNITVTFILLVDFFRHKKQ